VTERRTGSFEPSREEVSAEGPRAFAPVSSRAKAWALVASLAAHVALLAVAGVIAYHLTEARERREAESHTGPPTTVIAI
jgi:hypothetical protein